MDHIQKFPVRRGNCCEDTTVTQDFVQSLLRGQLISILNQKKLGWFFFLSQAQRSEF